MARWLPVLLILVGCSSKKKTDDKPAGSGSATAVASGSAAQQNFAAQWNVIVTEGVCSANEHGNCPPDTPCDPPTPRAIECPTGVTDGLVVVGQLADGSCVIATTNQKTPCPLPKGEALPPLAWAVTAQPDGTCRATWTSPATGTKSLTIKCPIADANVVIKRANKDAPCSVEHAGKKTDVPCPAEPKTLTAAQLRDAKDLAADQRVRIQGFHVASLDASTAGKATTFILGAADAKGDAKNAVRCMSKLAFIEIPDGEAVIVEGVPKKTPDGMQLVDCQAWSP